MDRYQIGLVYATLRMIGKVRLERTTDSLSWALCVWHGMEWPQPVSKATRGLSRNRSPKLLQHCCSTAFTSRMIVCSQASRQPTTGVRPHTCTTAQHYAVRRHFADHHIMCGNTCCMIPQALEDPNVQRLVLLSEACLPIQPWTHVKGIMFDTEKSYLGKTSMPKVTISSEIEATKGWWVYRRCNTKWWCTHVVCADPVCGVHEQSWPVCVDRRVYLMCGHRGRQTCVDSRASTLESAKPGP